MMEKKLGTGGLLRDIDGAPRDRIVGFDTEYGHLLANQNYNFDLQLEALKLFYTRFLRENGRQMQENGDRQYIDVGPRLEIATGEDTHILSAVYRALAGHVRLARLARMFNEEDPPCEFESIDANSIGVGTHISWGSHENALASDSLALKAYAPALIAHHASRVVWSGTGFAEPSNNSQDYSFYLSGKALAFKTLVGDQSMHDRPLVHIRNEPLADSVRFKRIHQITGETGFAPVAQGLRLASLSIILRACELGVEFEDLMPENPVGAMRSFARDPSLKSVVRLRGGQCVTALELQQEVLRRSVEAARGADYLTRQEEEWAAIWQKLLDDLSSDPALAADRVDWVNKQYFIERAVERRDSKKKAGAVAVMAATKYHRVYPEEGLGFKLLRKGRFMLAPPADTLDRGVELPKTRAAMRAGAISMLEKEDVGIWGEENWCYVIPHYIWPVKPLALMDPYEYDLGKVTDYVHKSLASISCKSEQ